MFLYIIKAIVIVFFFYGFYSAIIRIFEMIDNRKFTHCVFIDAQKIPSIEEAVYTAILHHPDREIYILNHDNTPDDEKEVIANLCKRYDFVYSLEKR